MLFYYLCTVGEQKFREVYPQGSQSKDADPYKWVTLYSGSPAVCQREHPEMHRWRPDEGGDEERVVRGYAALQWDREGFDPGTKIPELGADYASRWGPSRVVERIEDALTGTFLLLRIFPQGYHGRANEIGTKRSDVPEALAGRV
ncbi:MAG TPA: hypothetical protein VM052_08965 [Candidatus Limnocylindrales bacterium]|nr:hypothetical protein [Candidatus Limnocylindrales bacterium]